MLTSEYLLCNKMYSTYPERRVGGIFSFWCITFEQFVGSINMALLILNMPCSNSIKYTMKNFLFLTPEIIALDTQKRNKELRTCILRITLSIFPYNAIFFFLMYLLFLQPIHALICSCDLLFSSSLGIINIGKKTAKM